MRRDTAGQRGLTIVEILVATALFALVSVLALVQYQATRRALAAGQYLAELQQTTRRGFDLLTRDLYLAGLGVDPDGDPSRPDEAIEGAFAGAVVLRADLDAQTAKATDPEESLALGGAFDNVTTGNDEIVAYVLAKPDGTSTGSLVFEADVAGVPRDGLVERVSIESVAAVGDDPPYTLYRVVVRPDSTNTLRSPVADGIRALRLTYFDAAGNEMTPPGGAEDARRSRAEIRRIRIELEGLAPEPDPRWSDPEDSDPDTRHHRKFRIVAQLSPPNLDLGGRPDIGR